MHESTLDLELEKNCISLLITLEDPYITSVFSVPGIEPKH